MTRPDVPCAIYTRKSSEEGLEQSFNSLEAQREACRAFILSQRHEGWTAVSEHYDDGGFSGGTMERPALKRLLDDVQAGKVKTIVVYKVDRLTRSLTDFAKIIDIFDARGASFVSVTQQFNTTSSMGRLTLNVLLSFAQFEREITGERIRDKFAASKKKGMWMGGFVPLGYDCIERKLVVNQAEAITVREIFRHYLRLGCVKKLKQYLDRKESHSKLRIGTEGRRSGGAAFSRGALYHLLNNRIYIGQISHRDQHYTGQHHAIIQRSVWDQVAARLRSNNQSHRTGKSNSSPSLLSGKLFDAAGVRFTATHALKNGKRYRYYTSQAVINDSSRKPSLTRVPAQELEQIVRSKIHTLLEDSDHWNAGIKAGARREAAGDRGLEIARRWPKLESDEQDKFVRSVLARVVLGRTTASIEVNRANLIATIMGEDIRPSEAQPTNAKSVLTLVVAFQVNRRGSQIQLSTPDSDSTANRQPSMSLLKAVARARGWYEQIVNGEISTVRELAQKCNLPRRYVRRILTCAILSPRIIEALLIGQHRRSLTLDETLASVSLDWRKQEERILR
jgi:site-specific DNA recombinase